MSKLLVFVIAVFALIAISHQKPLDQQQPSNKDVNGTSAAMAPKANGETTPGVLTNPSQWQLVNSAANPQFQNEQMMESARTLSHHKPQLYSYSQYQVVPHAYAVPSYQVPAYEYSTPYVVSGYSHLPSYGYSGYSHYKNAEEDKSRQFMSVVPAENYISSLNPGVQYASKYIVDRPVSTGYSNLQGYYQPHSIQSMMQPMLFRKEHQGETLELRDAAEDKLSTFDPFTSMPYERNGLTINDKLEMQIPPNYLSERIQHLTPADISEQPSYSYNPQPAFSRAVEEPQPLEWSQQMPAFQRADASQQIHDYITPNDQVIMEPMPESGYVQSSRAAQDDMAMYSNWNQPMEMGQIQYFNNINAVAPQFQKLAPRFVNLTPGIRSVESSNVQNMSTEETIEKLSYLLKNLKANSQADSEKIDQQNGRRGESVGSKSSDVSVPALKKNA